MKPYSVLVSLCVLATICVTSTKGSCGLCRQVFKMYEYCSGQGSESAGTTPVTAAKVGKAGPRGPVGPPGTVNYTKVKLEIRNMFEAFENRMDIKISDFEAVLNEVIEREEMRNQRLNLMEVQLREIQVSIEASKKRAKCCKVWYGKHCYWIILHETRDLNYKNAALLCTDLEAIPAAILSVNHLNLIVDYGRTLVKSTWIGVWLGMEVDPQNSEVSFPNGTRAPELPWYPGHPTSGSEYTQLDLHIVKSPSVSNQGLWNAHPSTREHGVVCQY